MASKMMRTIAGAAAIFGVAVNLQGCGGESWEKKETDVYSNSKYLADFQYDMPKKDCEDACTNWKKSACEELCTKEKKCALGEDDDGRHFMKPGVCTLECVGFNMHADKHCTLFAKNVKLIADKGGHGTFYLRNDLPMEKPIDLPNNGAEPTPKPTPKKTTTEAPEETTTKAPKKTTTEAPKKTTTEAPEETTTEAPKKEDDKKEVIDKIETGKNEDVEIKGSKDKDVEIGEVDTEGPATFGRRLV